MTKKIKYRCYWFGFDGDLIWVELLEKLPKGARKPLSNVSVWVRDHENGDLEKICRIDSDIDFGTGIKIEYNTSMAFQGVN